MAKDESLFGEIFGTGGVFDRVFGPYKKPRIETREVISQKIRISIKKEHLARLLQGHTLTYNTPCCGDTVIEISPAEE